MFPFLALAAACAATGDRERQADEAYGQARYAEALAEYRSILGSGPTARVWAKAGAAALHAGDLREATDAYLKLAAEDPSRVGEAAEGLEAVARAAERQGEGDALREAALGLSAIAPDRAENRYALVLAQQPDLGDDELVELLPGAIAAASDPATVDSLLGRYARALQETAGCGQALLPLRALLRRTQDSLLRARARTGAADCALRLGQRAQAGGNDQDAVLWYAESARMDSSSATGRRALLGYAEARARQGDTLAAALALQTIVSASRNDSVGAEAAARLASFGLLPGEP